MRPFISGPKGYTAELEPVECRVLADLAEDVAVMVTAGANPVTVPGWVPDGWSHAVEPTSRPADPAVRRLLPAASTDEGIAAEFRRLATAEIIDRKNAGLCVLAGLLRGGSPVVVARPQADAVAGALTDIRLVLAERLHLSTDAEVEALYEEMSASLPSPRRRAARGDVVARRHLIAVFLVAGLLQESLVEGMLTDLRASRTE